MGDQIGRDVETTNAMRSTIFHNYCATGEWIDADKIPEGDLEEIKKWHVPSNVESHGGTTLKYSEAEKEGRVSLDEQFNYIETEEGIEPHQVADKYPNIVTSGSFDMAWYFPQYSLVIVIDIKSSIFAVKNRCESLQLNAYGIGYAGKKKAKKYAVGIFDAQQGKYYIGPIIEVDSFECEEYQERILYAARQTGDQYVKGTHCSQCWSRSSCKAHLEGVSDSAINRVMRVGATEQDVLAALVEAKRLQDQSEKLVDAAKSWINQHGSINSEDGRMKYGPVTTSGRKSLDQSAVSKALGVKNLSKYMKEGRDFSSFRWTNNK